MSKNFLILILLTIFILTSCAQNSDNKEITQNEPPEQESSHSIKDYSSIKLIDKFDNKLVKDTAFKKTEAQFSPLYIGESKAELKLTYKTDKIGSRVEEWDIYKRPDTKSITITIDTTRIVGSPMRIGEFYKKPEYRNEKMAYPVFIDNISNDTLSIGFGNILPIIIEAKDREGNWKPIQRPFIYPCGTGLTEFYLPPNQITLTSMKVFTGDYKTKLRLSFANSDHEIYSNEIDGQINIEQLE